MLSQLPVLRQSAVEPQSLNLLTRSYTSDPLTRQRIEVERLGMWLSSPEAQILSPKEWDEHLGRYLAEEATLEAMRAEAVLVRACWKCGGITVPEPHGLGRWCPHCEQFAEDGLALADDYEEAA